jgi:peroxiredoxin Q/BCP
LKAVEEPAETPAAAPVLEPIDIGDSLPSYILKNEQGEDVDVATLTAEKGAVLFSIPKADTCTSQYMKRPSTNWSYSGLHDAGVRVP